jgi:voltage-gated potassium channel
MSERERDAAREAAGRERREILEQLEAWLETPMLVLGLVWLALLMVELLWKEVWERNPLLDAISVVIWVVFIINFAVEFLIAPDKSEYLKRNWLTVVSLALPALRVFRIFRLARALRAARAARGLRLVKVVGSLNRGMRALGAAMRRRGFGYVVALTGLVTVAGAAGMYAFENEAAGGLQSYGEALWWTAMVMTTMGSQYWPQTAEGRVLCFILSLYAFAVFGYVTATLATFFVGRDAEADGAEIAGARQLAELKTEVVALREEIRALRREGA